MRSLFIFSALAVFSTILLAQSTAGIEVVVVVHEPSASDVGPYIANLHNNNDPRCLNPDYDPLQPTGQPQYLPAYGNGNGLSNELDSISPEFYALGGTSTHDLAVILNTSGADITVDATTITLASSRPAKDVPSQPEQSSPDGSAVSEVFAYDPVSVTIPDGSSVAVFMVRTKWRQSLDTSPRDYVWTFTFTDTGGNPFVLDAPLTVPKVGGSNPTGCAASDDGFPHGVWLVITGGLTAIVIRRKLLQKAMA